MTLWNGTVHPAADAFPMLDDERLAALAEGIKTGGLRNPGWLTPDGTLIDGRNRRKACELAGVEMRWEIYRGDDIVSFIVHQNVDRRDLTAGQRAAIACDLIPLYEQEALQRKAAAGRSSAPGKKAKKDSVNLRYLSEPADEPEHQSTDAAKAPKSSAGKTAGVVAALTGTSESGVEKFKALQASAPDLADQVRAGELTLNAARQTVVKRVNAEQKAKDKAARAAAAAELDRRAQEDWESEEARKRRDEQMFRADKELRRLLVMSDAQLSLDHDLMLSAQDNTTWSVVLNTAPKMIAMWTKMEERASERLES